MKKVLLILIVPLILFSCDYFEDDYEDFSEVYKNILIIRERFQNDSLKAANEIQKIYEKYDYTEESFKEEYFEIAQENPRMFYDLLDTIRESAKQELLDYENKLKAQKDSTEKKEE